MERVVAVGTPQLQGYVRKLWSEFIPQNFVPCISVNALSCEGIKVRSYTDVTMTIKRTFMRRRGIFEVLLLS